jgi:multidrug efflux pump subunit AcrB
MVIEGLPGIADDQTPRFLGKVTQTRALCRGGKNALASREIPLIWRRQRVRTLTVQSDVIHGALPESVAQDLGAQIDKLNAGLERGYSVVVGGAVEGDAVSRASVVAVLPLAGVLMLVILIIQPQSFQRIFLVLSVAPFGLVGVVAAMLLSGKPLGFVALLGVIALVGMIIRNSVILIDQIEVEIEHGRSACRD